MSEKSLMNDIMLAATERGARLFRNHVGVAWHGQTVVVATRENRVLLEPGDVLLRNASRVKSGFGVGSSDLIGWAPRVITADDVGKTVAQFLACETKSEFGVVSAEQRAFVDAVRAAHGLAGVARSIDDFERILR